MKLAFRVFAVVQRSLNQHREGNGNVFHVNVKNVLELELQKVIQQPTIVTDALGHLLFLPLILGYFFGVSNPFDDPSATLQYIVLDLVLLLDEVIDALSLRLVDIVNDLDLLCLVVLWEVYKLSICVLV